MKGKLYHKALRSFRCEIKSKGLIARIICRPSGLFHYWCLLWIFTLHSVSEAELHVSVLLDDHLIHQRYEHPRFKVRALFLFFQHTEEYFNAPPSFRLIFFLLSNGANFLAELCVLGKQRLLILLELILISLHPGVFFHQLPDALRHAQRLILQPCGSPIKFRGMDARYLSGRVNQFFAAARCPTIRMPSILHATSPALNLRTSTQRRLQISAGIGSSKMEYS